jgi:hypothetical protein
MTYIVLYWQNMMLKITQDSVQCGNKSCAQTHMWRLVMRTSKVYSSRVGGFKKHEQTSDDYQVRSGLSDPAPTNAASLKPRSGFFDWNLTVGEFGVS